MESWMTRTSWTRRAALAGLAATIGLGLGLGSAAAQEPRFDGVTLRVATFGGNWRDFVRDYVGAEIEKRGGKVEWVLGSPADSLAKLIAARGRAAPFDILEVTEPIQPDLLEGKFLAPINLANIPNLQHLRKDQYDQNLVASWTTQEGIVYNVEKFKELGLPAPTRFSDMLNPKLAGKVAFADISSGGGVPAVGGAIYDAGGSEANIDPGFDLIRKLSVKSYWKQGGDVVTQFKNGDVLIAAIGTGWGLQGMNSGLPLAVVHPQFPNGKKGIAKLGWLGIVKDTKAQAAAEFFINRYLDVDAQVQMAKGHGIVPVNALALAQLKEIPALDRALLLDPKEAGNMLTLDYSKIDMSVWLEKWNRMNASR